MDNNEQITKDIPMALGCVLGVILLFVVIAPNFIYRFIVDSFSDEVRESRFDINDYD